MSTNQRWIIVLGCAVLLALALSVRIATGDATTTATTRVEVERTVQGKTVDWWARHAVQARKDANARRLTVVRLRNTLNHDPSVQEAVKLATIVYPHFTEKRAWRIIRHESWMTRDPLHARNPRSTATGLYQFLTGTFRSTPFAGMSIYSAYAQSLAAGWMHEHGRGCEWAIDC